jgi:isoquinoline 1-oxidoreductase alpha subunit
MLTEGNGLPGAPAARTDPACPANWKHDTMSTSLLVNGRGRSVGRAPDTPLLWVLREDLGLTGAKYGCGAALCGACTVHVAGQAVRSCVMPLAAVGGKPVTTIEGAATPQARALEKAWIELQVAQCGYCQPGALMAAAALLTVTPRPTDAQIDAAITNLCRCGTYPRMRAAIHTAAAALGGPVRP